MSTPISRDNKLAGPDPYAPRRAQTTSPTTPPVEKNEEPPASDGDVWRTRADAADAQARLDEALRGAIEMARTRDSAPPAPAAPIGSAAPSTSPPGSINWPRRPSDLWRHDEPLMHAAVLSFSRHPELVPDPPVPVSVQRRGGLPMLVRLSLVVIAAAIVAYGFTEIFSVRRDSSLPQRSSEEVASIAAAPPAQSDAPIASANPSTPAIQPLDSDRAAALLQRGRELLRSGDIAAARLAFLPLADAGNAEAALALGATFDPRYLARQNVIGVAGNEAKARAWYQRAMELGSRKAKDMLARMATK